MNIIQLQDRLKGMPTEVIIQNLQNPTGAVPTYLLAGELGRRQKMEAEAAAQMPNDTVTEQLVQESSPQQTLGQMAPQAMAPMPVPPEQSGVANLPAPNVGQNYAGGGIVSFADGGPTVTRRPSDIEDIGTDLGLDYGLYKLFGAPGLFLTPNDIGDATLYSDEELAAKLAEQQAVEDVAVEEGLSDTEKGILGAGVVGATASTKKGQQGIKSILGKIPGVKKLKNIPKLLQSTPKAPKKGPGRPKKAPPPSPKGPLTQATVAGLKAIPKGVGPLTRGAKTALTRYPVETGLGALGLNALLNEGVLYGTDPAEIERKKLEATTKAEFEQAQKDRQDRLRADALAASEASKQSARERQRQKEMYLALALGGAKAMQGDSPYALQNIGAGLETGVSTLSAFDIARADRDAELAKTGADLGFEYLKMAQGADEKYRDQLIDILDSDDYQAYKRDLQLLVDDEDISQADMDSKLEAYIVNRIGILPSLQNKTSVGNKEFLRV